MSETWKRWEGQSVNGQFPLLRYAGGSRHSAVFFTRRKAAPEQAVIKLVAADPGTAAGQLQRWKKAAALSHPHLLRLFESGQCELEGTPLLYVVMETAEEDLSQILPERALTAAEVREMLPPVLDALTHIHGQGLTHGRVRPSNILAVENVVKVSTDTIRGSGELVASPDGWGGYDPPESSSRRLTSASDMWSLAVTLVQILTQQRPLWHPAEPAAPSLPEHTPEPFREIARHCLQVDPQQRWGVAEVAAALQPAPAKAGRARPSAGVDTNPEKKSKTWVYALGLIVALVVVGVLVLMGNKNRGSAPSAQTQEAASETGAKGGAPSEPLPPGRKSASTTGSAKGTVLERVMPNVSASARRTIEGKIKVDVRVSVDPSGKVTEAKLTSAGPSKYFARLALEAARDWKFSAPEKQGQAVASEWTLRFGYRRSGTDVVATQSVP